MSCRRLLCILASLALSLLFIGCGGSHSEEHASVKTLDVPLALPEHFAAIVINLRQIAAVPLVAEQLKDEQLAARIKQVGIDPSEVERIVVLFSMDPRVRNLAYPRPVLIAEFTHDVDPKDIIHKLEKLDGVEKPASLQEVQIAGKACIESEADPKNSPLTCALDSRTIVLAMRPMMEKLLSATGPSGPLYERLKKVPAGPDVIAVVDAGGITDFEKQIESAKKGAPPPAADYFDMVKNARGGVLYVNLTGDKLLEMVVENKDAETAAALERLLDDGRKMLGALVAGGPQSLSPDRKAAFAEALKLGDEAVDGLSIAKNGAEVSVVVKRPPSMDQLAGPALEKLKKFSREAAEEARSSSNLQQIAAAVMKFASANNNRYPAQAIESNGTPLLSWRVAILPYLGETRVYNRFHLRESWDSPHNLEVAKAMPRVYQTPGHESDGKTSIMVFAGKDTPFAGPYNTSLALMYDGISCTLLAAEAGPDKAVPWTKPEDLPFDPTNPLAALGNMPETGFSMVLFDGTVHRNPKIDNATLKALITPNGKDWFDWKMLDGN